MNVVVALEHRFDSTPDGTVWTSAQFAYGFWTRYLEVFEHVRVVARVREVSSAPPDWKRADGEGVSFAAVPYYIGPWQYLLRVQEVQRAARKAVGVRDAVILRVSSQIAACIEPLLIRTGHPYGVEVVCDPYDVFAPGSIKHPLRPFFRWLSPRELKRQCTGACAAAYVTEEVLQRRYPPAPEAFSTHYSSVELPVTAFVTAPYLPHSGRGLLTLINIGSMAQMYKAQDVLIDAIAACVREKANFKLILVGDGKHRAELETQAAKLGLKERIQFLGQLSAGDDVLEQLDRADLFVLPSHQEGLPRAMIEAMARGLPCIGSTVGGIPELLPSEDMVPPGDVAALANKICEVVTDPERMARMSVLNLEKAKNYKEEVLRKRRNNFYHQVRENTQAWLLTQKCLIAD